MSAKKLVERSDIALSRSRLGNFITFLNVQNCHLLGDKVLKAPDVSAFRNHVDLSCHSVVLPLDRDCASELAVQPHHFYLQVVSRRA